MGHFQSAAPQPPARPSYTGLSATIKAPSSVKPGDRLRYEVTITNNRSTDVAFDPCPAYTENLAGTGIKAVGTYLLNCGAAPSIAAGSSVTFEMVLDIPQWTQAGNAYLHWDFQDMGLRTPKGIPITVVAS